MVCRKNNFGASDDETKESSSKEAARYLKARSWQRFLAWQSRKRTREESNRKQTRHCVVADINLDRQSNQTCSRLPESFLSIEAESRRILHVKSDLWILAKQSYTTAHRECVTKFFF